MSSLRLQLSEREQALKDATERLRSSDLTKDSMERFIVSQRKPFTSPFDPISGFFTTEPQTAVFLSLELAVRRTCLLRRNDNLAE